MTINIAVPYREHEGDYGFILLADRRFKVRPDHGTEEDSDPRIFNSDKIYSTERLIAAISGKLNLEYETKPEEFNNPLEAIIKASLEGDIENLPFTIEPDSEYSIFVFEAIEEGIDFYTVSFYQGNITRDSISRMDGQVAHELVGYVNGITEISEYRTQHPVSTLQNAIWFARAIYAAADRAEGLVIEGQDIFKISTQGIEKID